LESEAHDNKIKAHSSHLEASLTEDEKQTLLHAVIDSLNKLGAIDYKLIRDIKNKYPHQTDNKEQEMTP
jgi:hypothetical protein